MKARYQPLDKTDIPEAWLKARGENKIFNFEFAYEAKGIKYYTSSDLKFNNSNPIPETDLIEMK